MAKKTNASFASAILGSEPTVNLTIGGKKVTMKLSDFMAAQAAAQAAPATPAPTVVKPEPVAPPAPIDFVAKAKEAECYKAARDAVKAAGLNYDPKTKTGGKFGANREAYWTAFWAGFNAKAVSVGIPQRNK